VIAMTATLLYALVQAGTFQDRLYYRLNVLHFELID
jgi:transcriptional regulator of acetoin/glycerol metabolism